jgi:hypothetical protein
MHMLPFFWTIIRTFLKQLWNLGLGFACASLGILDKRRIYSFLFCWS